LGSFNFSGSAGALGVEVGAEEFEGNFGKKYIRLEEWMLFPMHSPKL